MHPHARILAEAILLYVLLPVGALATGALLLPAADPALPASLRLVAGALAGSYVGLAALAILRSARRSRAALPSPPDKQGRALGGAGSGPARGARRS